MTTNQRGRCARLSYKSRLFTWTEFENNLNYYCDEEIIMDQIRVETNGWVEETADTTELRPVKINKLVSEGIQEQVSFEDDVASVGPAEEIHFLRQTVDALKHELHQSCVGRERTEGELNDMANMLKEISKENDEMLKEFNKLVEDNAVISRDLKQSKINEQHLQVRLSEKRNADQESDGVIVRLQSQLEAMTNEKEELEIMTEHLNEELEIMRDSLHSVLDEKRELEKKVKKMQKQLDRLIAHFENSQNNNNNNSSMMRLRRGRNNSIGDASDVEHSALNEEVMEPPTPATIPLFSKLNHRIKSRRSASLGRAEETFPNGDNEGDYSVLSFMSEPGILRHPDTVLEDLGKIAIAQVGHEMNQSPDISSEHLNSNDTSKNINEEVPDSGSLESLKQRNESTGDINRVEDEHSNTSQPPQRWGIKIPHNVRRSRWGQKVFSG